MEMELIKPPCLEPGDTLGLIAPSGPVIRNNDIPAGTMPSHLEKGIAYLEKMGYHPVLGKHVLNRRGYLAGTDKERLEDLHAMLANPKIKGIFCVAGGYGTPRLLPHIDYELLRKNPKIFEGYSDITALNNTFFSLTGLVTFEGPMANYDFGRHIDFNRDNLWKVMTQREPVGEVPVPDDYPSMETLYPGKTSGRLIGGNLSLLAATLGTPYEIDTRDKILFLEDIDEYPYRLDRMLNHLILAGKLQQASGIIIGECVDCIPDPPENPSLSLMEIFDDLIVPLQKPTFYGLPCGHGTYKLTLPIGIQSSMDADRCKLYLEESAVS